MKVKTWFSIIKLECENRLCQYFNDYLHHYKYKGFLTFQNYRENLNIFECSISAYTCTYRWNTVTKNTQWSKSKYISNINLCNFIFRYKMLIEFFITLICLQDVHIYIYIYI